MLDKRIFDVVDDAASVSVESYVRAAKAEGKRDFSFLEGYRTILVLALSHPDGQPVLKGDAYGLVARYAHGTDYHHVFKKKLQALEDLFKAEGHQAKGAVDVNPIDERLAAALSGMGYIGHNKLLIHPRYGTRVFLATLTTDKDIRLDGYETDSCGDCRACIEACPGGALSVGGYDERRCVSYLTQTKEPLTEAQLRLFDTYVFGCDVCQDVCPKNADIEPIDREAFHSDAQAQLYLPEILDASNRALSRRFGAYAFAWRGGLVLKRNASALLWNRRRHRDRIETVHYRHAHVDWFEVTLRRLLAKDGEDA